MSRKKKRPKRKKSPPAKTSFPKESRGAEVLTIAWMLSLLATLLAELASAAMWLLSLTEPGGHILLLSKLMLLTAAIAGFVCLILTPITWRARIRKPPPVIAVVAILASLVPQILLLFTAIWE